MNGIPSAELSLSPQSATVQQLNENDVDCK